MRAEIADKSAPTERAATGRGLREGGIMGDLRASTARLRH
jgi:hypothetical protein